MNTSDHSFGAGADAARVLISVVGALCLWAGLRGVAADANDNPYRAIVERNAFGLQAPPAAEPGSPPPRPASRITLTGITTIFGDKRALLITQAPARAGQPPAEQSYILAEGQRDGDIQVLAVDEKAGTVKVNCAGLVTTINFADNGVQVASGGPASSAGRLPLASVADRRLAQAALLPKANAALAANVTSVSRLEAEENPPKIRMSRRLAYLRMAQ